MSRKNFYHGAIAGILSALACFIYNRIYLFATEVDFARVLNPAAIIGANLLACMIASIFFGFFSKWFKSKGEIIFSLAFAILSFGSIVIPISISLPLDVKNPELFPGLAVPMHFFPALAWFTTRPLFADHKNAS
ncbi:MAG TPA: hypothetical protein VNV85_00425 [Puia sp.]|jgi:MFS family permease|nr:hypothetical protein [Puia sp.]